MTEQGEKYKGEFAETHRPDPEEVKARKSRNLWLGLALAGFVILVGIITFIRLSSADLSKGGFYYDPQDRPSGAARELPPGMAEDQAAPPPNLAPIEEAPEAEPADPPQEAPE